MILHCNLGTHSAQKGGIYSDKVLGYGDTVVVL